MKTLKHFLILIFVFALPLFMSNCEKEELILSPSGDDLKSAEVESDLYLEEPVLVFGPEEFVRAKGIPQIITREINIEEFEPIQDFFKISVSTGLQSSENSASSAIVKINGELIFNPSDFKNNPRILEALIESGDIIVLDVEMRGKPGDMIKIWIEGFEHSQNSPIYFEQAYPGQTGQIVDVTLGGVPIKCRLVNGEYVWQGDIILTEEQLSGQSALKGTAPRFFNVDKVKKWPDGIVYYTLNSVVPSEADIDRAINEWEYATSLEFVVRTTEENYIEFAYDNETTDSNLGMIGGKQVIRLQAGTEYGNVMHEIGHSIGLHHEQCRSDRDKYITVYYNNIIEGADNINFKPCPFSRNTSSFDYKSIMIYGSINNSAIFSGLPNMVRSSDYSEWKAQRKYLSEGDIEIVERLYGESDPQHFWDERDGTPYRYVEIGDQTWMAENLKYLPEVKPAPQSVNVSYDASYYVYDYYGTKVGEAVATDNYAEYGVLYNWEAAKHACPDGWHLPSDEEWKTLEIETGLSRAEADAQDRSGTFGGDKLKEAGYDHWDYWNYGSKATNEYGFSALGGGYMSTDFYSKEYWCIFLTSSEHPQDRDYVWFRGLNHSYSHILRDPIAKYFGGSVRCVKN